MSTNFYEILGVSKAASEEEIKKAFRTKAFELHPDRNPGNKAAEESFKKVNEAYQVLSDPEKRRNYDTFGTENPGGVYQHPGGMPVNPFDIFNTQFHDFFGSESFKDFRRTVYQKKQELHGELFVELHEILTGCIKETEITINQHCQTCFGSGKGPTVCPTCGGRGSITANVKNFHMTRTCLTCSGSGRNMCSSCMGSGFTNPIKKTVKITIPPGIRDMSTIRIKPGDQELLILVRVAIPLDTEVDFSSGDVYKYVTLNYPTIILGGETTYETIDKRTEKIYINSNTKPGETVRIPQQGIPVNPKKTSQRGNLYLKVRLLIPAKETLSEEQLKILSELQNLEK